MSSWQISTSSCSVSERMRTKCRRGAVFSAAEAPVMLDGDSRATGHAGRAAGAALGPILLHLCNCSTRRVASRLLRALSNQVGVCITKREKAESEAQRGKPKGTLESEIRNAIS